MPVTPNEQQSPWMKPGERLDDLQRNGLYLIQNPSAFCFGMDAVLLADFAQIRPKERVADLGTGTGILPLLLSQNQPTASFEAIELQESMAEMARRSVGLNGLQERIRVHCSDMRSAWQLIGRESVHAVVCNPPYGKAGGTIVSTSETVQLSRHEADLTVSEVAKSAASILKNQGRFYVVFPAQRMMELLRALTDAKLEPKKIRLVCSKLSKPPYLLLVEAIKNAKPSMLWMPPLVVYHEDGSETEELQRIYHKKV